MILYEFEGKQLLSRAGINVPKSQLIASSQDIINLDALIILKAQVLSGKRAQAGGILTLKGSEDLNSRMEELLDKTINKERVNRVLAEELIEFEGPEYYLSIAYDADSRGPVLTFSKSGGTGIEDRKAATIRINPLDLSNLDPQVYSLGLPQQLVESAIKVFFDNDCLLLEVNPLVQNKQGEWVVLDAKIKLDDSAKPRHEEWSLYPPRAAPGYNPTKNEIEAKKIDEGDFRGVAGSTYFDFDGDIAILASGGGASLTALDVLIKAGGRPANYTEYGGNPPKEKVAKLTQIVLSKPNLHGLWVVGAVANFTDVYETLSGFLEALRRVKPKVKIPIVIRRGGPRDKEAFVMLKQVKDFELHLYGEETSITRSAEVMVDLAKKYATS